MRGMQEFTAWGLLSGAFFVISMASTLFAINLLGLSTASGVWCGIAGEFCQSLNMLASFLLVGDRCCSTFWLLHRVCAVWILWVGQSFTLHFVAMQWWSASRLGSRAQAM